MRQDKMNYRKKCEELQGRSDVSVTTGFQERINARLPDDTPSVGYINF